MRAATIREVRALLPKLEEELGKTSEIVVTKRGKPIARLLPMAGARPRRPSHDDLRASLPFQHVPSEVLVRADRDERD